ncbi:DsrE family protein [Ferrovum sp.]|uniref:DsrE/DsrF/TusD sulfur relay family protein n=1 Tax=Ferrovum sp. TaxID=2609467 RepID=UPI002630E1E2|nr:DsrE family protein [Ferrovum sp.]
MNTLFILNDPPYGSERTYNGLRLAGHLSKQEGSSVRVFLIGDAASTAHRNQKVPQGFYNTEVMLGSVIRHGGEVGVCGTCMDARGMGDSDILDGAHRSTLAELAEWTAWADKVLVF